MSQLKTEVVQKAELLPNLIALLGEKHAELIALNEQIASAKLKSSETITSINELQERIDASLLATKHQFAVEGTTWHRNKNLIGGIDGKITDLDKTACGA